MTITEHTLDRALLYKLGGDFSFSCRREFNAAVERFCQGNKSVLLVDMRDVGFIDSAALGLIALANQTVRKINRRVALLRPQSYVRDILKMANMQHNVPVCETEVEAIKQCSLVGSA